MPQELSFDVELYFLLHMADGTARATRHVRLPFPPFAGLELWLPGHEDSDEIRSVAWVVEESRFVCHTGDDEDQTPLAEACDYWRNQGWDVEVLSTGPKPQE